MLSVTESGDQCGNRWQMSSHYPKPEGESSASAAALNPFSLQKFGLIMAGRQMM